MILLTPLLLIAGSCEEALDNMHKEIVTWMCNTVPEIVQELATEALNSVVAENN